MFSVLSNTRNSNFNIAISIAFTLIVVFTFLAAPSMVAPQPASISVTGSQDAYMEYRRGEWVSVPIPQSEAFDMSAYHLSERTLIDENAGLSIYLLSEHTLVDPQAGLEAYFNSERTGIPVLFTKYQRSEWFGK